MTDNDLADKVVLISGVGPGLGRRLAWQVLENGARVVLGDMNGAQVESIRRELQAGSRAVAVEADIRSSKGCEDLVNVARSIYNRLDGLVHVAAVDNAVGGLLDGELGDWSPTSEVIVKGTLQLTKTAVPLIRDSGGGTIVMVGSIAAAEPVDQVVQLVYGMSKAALNTASYYLSRELGPLGIRVNTVAPGWMWGRTLQQAMNRAAVDAGVSVATLLEPVVAQTSLRRLATEEDVANCITFLLSDKAAAITGQTLYVDAGICH